MNTSLISLLSSSPRDGVVIDSPSSIFRRMLEAAGDNHEFLFRELISKACSFDENAPTHEYMEEFYKVLEHVFRASPEWVFSDIGLKGLDQILRFTPSTLLNKKILLIEHLITRYFLSETFIKERKKDEEGARLYFPLQEHQTTLLPLRLWRFCLLPAMFYCRVLIDMVPQEERERYAVLASSLLYRFIDFEIIESGYFDHEMSTQDQILFLSHSRIEHPSINKKIYEDLKTELEEHEKDLQLPPHDDFAANFPRRILEDYPAGLRQCREQVVSIFLRGGAIPRPDEIRGKQREMTRIFWNFFTDNFLADALSILGPAPCSYVIVPAGSFGREEVTSLSNLKCFILIEDFSKIEYFNKLARLIELLVVLLGETEVKVPIFPSWKESGSKGFYINHTTKEGIEESGILIIALNQPDFTIRRADQTDLTRLMALTNEPPLDYSLFKLPCILLSGNEELLGSYLNSIRSRFRGPVIATTHYKTFGERVAYQNIKERISEYRKLSSSSFFTDPFDIKTCIIVPLTLLLSYLHLYFRDRRYSVVQSSRGEERVHPLTNTLDLIDDLEEVFDQESRELLKQCVSQLYLIRVRLHHAYGVDQSSQKDFAIMDRSHLKIKRLFGGEKELVNRTRWLVLNPLYDFVEKALQKSVPFKDAMREISLKNLMLADLDKRLLLVKDLQEKIDYDEDLSKAMKRQHRKEKRESLHQLIEICRELSRYLLEIRAPVEQHECIYRLFSDDPAFERLRIAYLKKLEHHQLHVHLARIPNRDGTRQSTRLDEEKFESNLLKIVQRQSTYGSVTCRVTSPILKERFYMSQEVINAILTPNGDLKNEITGTDRNGCRYQRGTVDLNFRIPFQPLAEYAVYALLSRIMGKGAPVTELARFEVTVSWKRKVYPVLITETIHGTNLKDALTHYPFPIDRYHLTLMQLCTLLIRPGNGQALHHVLTTQNQIYSNHNEISFVEPFGNSRKRLGLSLEKKLNFCSILFCLNEPLDQEALRQFAVLDASSILTAWLEDIERRKKSFTTLFNPMEREILYTRDPKQPFTPTLMFSEQESSRIFLQFRHLQKYILQTNNNPSTLSSQNSSFSLRSSRNSEIDDLDFVLIEGNSQPASSSSSTVHITALDLLEQMITLVEKDERPPLGRDLRTAYSLAMSENPETWLNKATNAGSKAMTPAEVYKASLDYIPTIADLENDQSIHQAKKTLAVYTFPYQKALARKGNGIVELNFLRWSSSMEKTVVLKNLIEMLNEREAKPTTLILTHCEVLTDEMLLSLLNAQLEVLDLTGCLNISNTRSIAALSPNLQKLNLSDCFGLKLFVGPNDGVANFADLEELKIENCPELSKMALQSRFLKKLIVIDNPKLRELDLDLTFPMTEVTVENCPLLDPNWSQVTRQMIKVNLKTHLNQSGVDHEILLRLIENDPKLTELDLSGLEIDDFGAQSLATALKYNSHLTTLNLCDNQIGDIGAMALAAVIECNSTLTKLKLHNNQIAEEGATALANAIQYNFCLSALWLDSNKIGDAGAMAFAKALKHNSSLTKLWLNNNQISDEGATKLAGAIGENLTLTVLGLSKNQIGDTGAIALARDLGYNSTLTVLDLSKNQIGDTGATALARVLGYNSALTVLGLSKNQIGDEGAIKLAKALENNSSLTTFGLSKNQIGNAGAIAFVTALEQNSTLKRFYLSKNQIGDIGAIALTTLLGHNSTIIELNLEKNEISEAVAMELEKALFYSFLKRELKDSDLLNEFDLNESEIDIFYIAFVQGLERRALERNTSVIELSQDDEVEEEGLVSLATIMNADFYPDLFVEAFAKILEQNSTITKLDLSKRQIGDVGATALATALRCNCTLIKLDLHKNQIGNEGATALAASLEHNSTLTVLNLEKNQIGDEGAAAFLAALVDHNSTSILFLNRNPISEAMMSLLIRALFREVFNRLFDLIQFDLKKSEIDALYIFVLDGLERKCQEDNVSLVNFLDDFETDDFVAVLNTNSIMMNLVGDLFLEGLPKHALFRGLKKRLEKASVLINLGLSEIHVDEFWVVFESVLERRAFEQNVSVEQLILDHKLRESLIFEAVVRFLEQNSTLTTLNLNDREIDDERVAALSPGLKQNMALTVLHLKKNRIGDLGAIELATILESSSSLTELNLDENEIGHIGATAFARALKHQSTLTTLSLNHNRINNTGLAALARALEHNSTLTGLYVLRNGINQDGIKELIKTLEHNSTLTDLACYYIRNPLYREPDLRENVNNALTRNKKLKEEKALSSSKIAEKNLDVSPFTLYDEFKSTSTNSSEDVLEFIYGRVSYQRRHLTLGDGACGLHALVGKRVGGEYIWNPKGLDLSRTAEIQREAKVAFINAIRPILTRDPSYLRNLLHHSMEERLTETVEFKAWNAPFEEQFTHIREELLTLLTFGFYERIRERVAPTFQKTPKEYLKLIEAIEHPQTFSECFCNCINANFEEFKDLNLGDPIWERILGFRELKEGIEQTREHALHAFIDSHFELYAKIIEDSDCYLSADELKLAAELLQPDNKVLIFYHRDVPPHVINSNAIGETIAIEHSIVYHSNGRHFSRLEAVKHS